MLALEVGNLDGLLIIGIIIMLGPSILLAVIGALLSYNNKKAAAKVLFIIAVVYAIISLGICATLLFSY